LRLQQKVVTHAWSLHVNLSLLVICVVDAWLLCASTRGAAAALTENQFYNDHAAQLIDNT